MPTFVAFDLTEEASYLHFLTCHLLGLHRMELFHYADLQLLRPSRGVRASSRGLHFIIVIRCVVLIGDWENKPSGK